MKFTVSSSALLSHLQAISRVINSKTSIPILDSFLFRLEGDVLKMTASDIETTLVTSMEVLNPEGDGLFALSAKQLLDPLKDFTEQPLTFDIDLDSMAVTLVSPYGKYCFVGQNGEEYPKMNEIKETATWFTPDAQQLLKGITRTIFASADDELRPVMNGIFFDLAPEGVTMVASDGHKLVKYTTTEVNSELKTSFILPKKPANLLKNILPKEDGTIKVGFEDKNAVFIMSGYQLSCRLIDGRFPNYNSVIPQNNPNKVIIDRVSLMNSVKRVASFSNQATNLIKLFFDNNSVVITAQDLDFSTSGEESITCQYDGNPLKIGFKATFLVELLNNIPSSEVVLELADQSRAGIILPSENEEKEILLTLLMPMMLND